MIEAESLLVLAISEAFSCIYLNHTSTIPTLISDDSCIRNMNKSRSYPFPSQNKVILLFQKIICNFDDHIKFEFDESNRKGCLQTLSVHSKGNSSVKR